MRIAQIAKYWSDSITGGMPIASRTLAVALAKRGHEVVSYTSAGPAQFTDHGVRVVKLPGHGMTLEFAENIKGVKTSDFDVILSESGTGIPLFDKATRPVRLVRMHGMSLDYIQTWLNMTVLGESRDWKVDAGIDVRDKYNQVIHEIRDLRKADRVIAISDSTFNDMVLRMHLQNVSLIYNPVDTDLFKPADTTPGFRLITTSMLHEVKAVEEAIWVAHTAGYPLTVVGTGSEEPRLRELARKLRANVLFKGAVPHERMPDEYATASVFIDTSAHHSGLNLTALEAMACGKPVIGSDTGGKRSYGCASLYPMGDIEEGARCVRRLMENQDELVMRSGVAREHAVVTFSLDKICEKYERLIEQVKEEKNREHER